jgi:lysophospholipase L1-like esterase
VVAAAATAAAFMLNRPKTDRPSLDIAVVGDSYTAGRLNQVVWPTLLAQRTGWSVANFALPGTGFAADGTGGQAITWQVDRALAARPRTVLMVGGSEDGRFAGTGNIQTSAVDGINKVIRAGKQALVIGPTWFAVPVPPTVAAVSDEIRQAAEQSQTPFLNALNPPWLTPAQMLPDRSGPNDDGQSVIADKVAAWLRTQGWT